MIAIERGQVYEACDGSGRRIRVIGKPGTVPGTGGFGKAWIESITPNGGGIRQRKIEVTELHDSAVTSSGEPRRTGYALIWGS